MVTIGSGVFIRPQVGHSTGPKDCSFNHIFLKLNIRLKIVYDGRSRTCYTSRLQNPWCLVRSKVTGMCL